MVHGTNPGDVNILHHTKGILAPDNIAPVIIPAQTLERLKRVTFCNNPMQNLKRGHGFKSVHRCKSSCQGDINPKKISAKIKFFPDLVMFLSY